MATLLLTVADGNFNNNNAAQGYSNKLAIVFGIVATALGAVAVLVGFLQLRACKRRCCERSSKDLELGVIEAKTAAPSKTTGSNIENTCFVRRAVLNICDTIEDRRRAPSAPVRVDDFSADVSMESLSSTIVDTSKHT